MPVNVLKNLLTTLLVALVMTQAAQAFAQTQTQTQQPASATARAPIQWVNVKAALDAPIGTRLYIRCNLVSVAAPRPQSRQPWSLYVNDETGTIRTVVFQDTWAKIPDTSVLAPGTRLDLYARVGEYRGERQLEIEAPNNFRRTPGTVSAAGLRSSRDDKQTFSLVSIGSINITHAGQPLRVRGVVTKYVPAENERTPFRVMVKDETGEVEGLYWKSVADKITAENRPVVGQPIELRGIATEFDGRMQVRVDESQHVSRTFQVNARRARGPETSATAGLPATPGPVPSN